MKPFEALQIVEVAGSHAGAFAAKLFADFGASVVRIEPLGGDPLRSSGEAWGPIGSEFAFFNTSKRAATLDLDDADGRSDLAALLDFADVVIESAAPDPLEPVTDLLGSDQLIRAYISPFGLSGPYAGYRSNVFTDDAIGGHMFLSGEPDREPLPRAGAHTQLQAGMHAFIGCLAALLARERIGRGQTVEVSHFEGMAALHQHTSVMWTHGHHLLRREGNTQPGFWHPAGVYPCKDGHVFLSHAGGRKLIPFVQVLGYGHLFEDPRFATDPERAKHKREFDEALIPRLMELTAEEITEAGRYTFSPVGPVPAMLDVLNDEQFEARDFWTELPGDPSLRVPRGPFTIEGHMPQPGPPPEASTTSVDEIVGAWHEPMSSEAHEQLGDGPLQGIRLLDLTRVWAGPIGARILGDLGADVISIEAPWSRGYREVDAEYAALTHLYPEDDPGERPWNRVGGMNKLARNKRGVSLNLREDDAREVFAQLVAHADVVLENYSPRVMPQLGFDFDALRGLNERIVYVSMPGYGSTGPGQNRVALGPVIEAAVGLTAMMGYPDSGPYRSGVAWADPVSGMAAAAGTLVGLWDRAVSGHAQRVEAAMSESMATFAGDEILAAQVRGTNAPRRGSRHPRFAPQGAYRCAGDDRWIAISCTADEEWHALCAVAGLDPTLAGLDERARRERHDEIDAAISAWTLASSPREVMERLQACGVIAAQVSDARDLVEDPHLAARGFWVELDQLDVGPRRYPGNPIRLSETPVTYRRPAPGLGEHNDEVLGGLLGLPAATLKSLREAGAVADEPPEMPSA